MCDLATQHRVGLGVHRLRVDLALDEPALRAVGEDLELRHAEGRASGERLEDGWIAQLSLASERCPGALELPCPVVRGCERGRAVCVVDGKTRQRTEPFALGGGGFE